MHSILHNENLFHNLIALSVLSYPIVKSADDYDYNDDTQWD